ncbi:hypothetical protein NIES4075_05450 [Tolypothrix sp. NIES-4075]|nr:hypothetical protein NIES4075_05450 [Tolypothrix sp. NIES-4075]
MFHPPGSSVRIDGNRPLRLIHRQSQMPLSATNHFNTRWNILFFGSPQNRKSMAPKSIDVNEMIISELWESPQVLSEPLSWVFLPR